MNVFKTPLKPQKGSKLKEADSSFLLAHSLKRPSDLNSRKNENPYLIQNLLIDDGIVLCAGLPKVKKSFFVADLLVSISTATKAFSIFDVMKRGPCLLIQGEDSEEIIRSRLEAIALSRGLSLSRLNDIFITSTQDFKLDNPEHLNDLEQTVQKLGVVAVFIDPLSRLISTSDGSAAPMGRLLTSLRAFQRRTKICLALVTHMRKGKSESDLGAIKGVGDLRSAYDQGILLTKPCGEITQCSFDFKSVGQLPDMFFHLQNVNGFPVPIMVGADQIRSKVV